MEAFQDCCACVWFFTKTSKPKFDEQKQNNDLLSLSLLPDYTTNFFFFFPLIFPAIGGTAVSAEMP